MVIYYSNCGKKKHYQICEKIFNLSLFVTLIQQLPVVREYADGYIRMFLYIILGTLFLYTIINKRNIKLPSFILAFILTSITFTIFLVLILILGVPVTIENILLLLIPLAILIISYNLNYSKKQLNRLLYTYVILSIIVGISIIFYYGEGFKITQLYFLKAKNQVGPIFGISCLIIFYKLINCSQESIPRNSFFKTIVKIALIVLLFTILLVIRNRSGLLALIFVSSFMFFKHKKRKISIKSILLLLLSISIFAFMISVGIVGEILNYIWASFTLNYDISNLDSISATRTIVYALSFQFIKAHPLFGAISHPIMWEGIPHNYILYYLVNYGIIGSLPVMLFYCYLWGFAFTKFRKKVDDKLAIYLLFFVLITSMFEYTHPYGPGVTQIMVWFMIGQYLRNTKENNLVFINARKNRNLDINKFIQEGISVEYE